MNTNIYQRLHQIQIQLNYLTKTETNHYQHYKYVSEYQILTFLKPLLARVGLTLIFSDSPEHFNAEKLEKEWVVKYRKEAKLFSAENPTGLTFYFWALGSNADIAKAKGSAETYAVKYFLQKLFLIPTADSLDPDKLDNAKDRPLTEEEKKQLEQFWAKHK